MQYSDDAGWNAAPEFDDALAWLGSSSLFSIHPAPGLVSFGLGAVNDAASFAEVDYLKTTPLGLKLVASVRNWTDQAHIVPSTREFDRFVEHYMSAFLTLNPGAATQELQEPDSEMVAK